MYKVIGQTAAAAAPPGWTRLWIVAEIESDNGQCLFDYESLTEKRTWFTPSTTDQYSIYRAFQSIREAMLAANQAQWRSATFSLEPNGKCNMHFEYES